MHIFHRTIQSTRNINSYGDVVVGNLLTGNASLWLKSPVLPRLVLCDIKIRNFENVALYTA